MSDKKENSVSEAAIFRALRGDLPRAEAFETRVRERLTEVEGPRGVVLRFADWIGVRERAASIAGPVLLPLGLIRSGTVGAAALKGAVPKSLLSTVALPFAALLVIGVTLHLSLRKTVRLRGENGTDVHAALLQEQWWSERRGSSAMVIALLVVVGFISPKTAKMIFYLIALMSHALCADVLSKARAASRRTVAISAINVGSTLYVAQWIMALGAGALAFTLDPLLGWTRERPPIEPKLLATSLAALTLAVMTFAAVQSRSSFLRPWRFLTEGTHLDIARLVALVVIVLALPALAVSGHDYVQQLEGTLGSRIWASRAILAWFAFCIHAMVLVKRAPLDSPPRP